MPLRVPSEVGAIDRMKLGHALEDRRGAVLAFSLLVFFWGSVWGAIKIGLEYAPPVLFAGTRMLICGAVLTLAALVWGGRANVRDGWPVYLLLAFFNVALFYGLQTLAVLFMPSGTAAVVVYLQPVLVGFLSYPVLGEALSAAKIVGLLLGFSGVVVVSAGSLSGASSLGTPLGVALGVASAISWALGTVYFKRYAGRLPVLWAVGGPFLLGGVCITGLGLALEDPAGITWTGTFVAALLYASLVGTAIAWVLWLGLIRADEASRVSAYVFFVPLVAVVLGALFLGERVGPSLLVGAALVVSGIYLVNRRGERPARETGEVGEEASGSHPR
jgi:drug/metabolite transporter (DMT)-like permease